MAFNTSSCIKVSDTKIFLHWTASRLIKNGLLLIENNNFIVKRVRNGASIFIQIKVMVKKSMPTYCNAY